ncbi:MAG: hypothetical protein HQ568_00690 [Calditrichaeota bacterium]|nr:hypothetical protein [Calditrichota bacterium]
MLYRLGEPPNIEYTEFALQVNDDIIYIGIIYPELVSAPAPTSFFIASQSYPDFNSSIIQLKYLDFYEGTIDLRNDTRIINSLKNSDILHHGIKCIIDSINLSAENDSSIIYSFTIKNLDDIAYYILDPEKMGNGHFNNYTGGMYLISKETGEYNFPRVDYSLPEWNNIDIDDLSILEAHEETSFTIESSYFHKIVQGSYECNLNYGNLRHLYTFNLTLDQQNGRIWIGGTKAQIVCDIVD